MKTKLTLALAVTTALLTTGAIAGPGFVDRPAAAPRIAAPAHAHKPACKTMTIATNPKAAAPSVVRCEAFAKVRAAECRLACR